MIMPDDKKKASTLIVSGLSGPMKPAPLTEDGAEQDDSMAKEAAGEELLAAIQSKSPKALMEALKAAMQLCEESEESYD